MGISNYYWSWGRLGSQRLQRSCKFQCKEVLWSLQFSQSQTYTPQESFLLSSLYIWRQRQHSLFHFSPYAGGWLGSQWLFPEETCILTWASRKYDDLYLLKVVKKWVKLDEHYVTLFLFFKSFFLLSLQAGLFVIQFVCYSVHTAWSGQ